MTLLLVLSQLAFAAPGAQRIEVSLEQASAESPARKQEIAQSAVEEIGAATREVEKMADQAAKSGVADDVKCVAEKLTKLRALLTLSKASQLEMNGFIASNDGVHAEQQVRRVLVALTRARELLAQAKSCGSGEGLAQGGQNVEVTGASESLVEVSDEDAYTVEPPLASPN